MVRARGIDILPLGRASRRGEAHSPVAAALRTDTGAICGLAPSPTRVRYSHHQAVVRTPPHPYGAHTRPWMLSRLWPGATGFSRRDKHAFDWEDTFSRYSHDT